MGAKVGTLQKTGLDAVVERTTSINRVGVSGRYHKMPKKLEDDYILEDKVLGSGYNGQVRRARGKADTTKRFAVKGFKLLGISNEARSDLESEVEVFLMMDHPHVARLSDVYETPERLNLVMECMEGGELFHRIQQKKRFSEHSAAAAAFQMLQALNYIHTHNIVHRDIKLENFLYEAKDGDQLKLIDFGFSKIWDTQTKMKLSCGTLAYVAPEVLGKSYDLKCDMWSFGVCVFVLLLGYMPFAGSESAQKRKVKEGAFERKEKQWKSLSKPAESFILSLLQVDSKQRLSAADALNHKWLDARNGDLPDSLGVNEDVAKSLVEFANCSVFRRSCMSMMAWSLSMEERNAVQREFEKLDADNSGTITINEFKGVLEDQFHMEDEAVMAAFGCLDMNHQDEIHYSEFLAATVASRIHLHDDLLRATFKRFDADNSGFITSDELRNVFGPCIDKQDLDSFMEEVDTSHDGKISYDEFITYLRHPEACDKHAGAADKLIDHLRQGTDHHEKMPTNMRRKGARGEDEAMGVFACCAQS